MSPIPQVDRNVRKTPPPPKPPPAPPKAGPGPATAPPKKGLPTKDSFQPQKQMGPVAPPPGSKGQKISNAKNPLTEKEDPKGLANPETYPKLLDTPISTAQQVSALKDKVDTVYKPNRDEGNGRIKSVWNGGLRENYKNFKLESANPKDLGTKPWLNVANKANPVATKLAPGAGVLLFGDKGTKALDALKGGLTSRNPETRNKALGDLADGGKTATEALKAGIETGRDVQKYGSAYRAVNKSLAEGAPGLNDKARRGIVRDITKNVFNNVDAGDVERAAGGSKYTELKDANRAGATDRVAKAHDLSNNQAKRLLSGGADSGVKAADDALKAGIKAGAKSASGVLAKTAGRFVPGANVAIAAFDAAKAYSTWKDPKASTGQKTTAIITAAGSALAATNIPIVSQAGAAVSTVSDFVGSFF
ncbi:hypothetical protein [Myxococcus stipitatus]|uniref:hypothetical protein n=1 Tax=Myxococcus stipitatus TaxID=83455 RepID=UPI0030D00B83